MRISDWSSDVCSSDLAALLGAMMIDNRVADDVLDRIEEEHFYEPVHGRIFGAIRTLRAGDMLATPVTLRPMFEADEGMKELGGPAYLAQLTGSGAGRSEERTSELQSLMRISYAVFCLKKKNNSQKILDRLIAPQT